MDSALTSTSHDTESCLGGASIKATHHESLSSPLKYDSLQQWRTAIQAAIDKKKVTEAQAMEAAVEQAKEDLETWNTGRKQRIDVASVDKDAISVDGGTHTFCWKSTAEMLTRVGFNPNDLSGKPSQKMADLVFARAKQ
ncbi:hypothetical protein BBOV_III002302 [Babesia bovis T2Bo]|uniref:hypothetical protein n=1 Tax=Babesia bovis T2Bo TaxID=484906 RepID=UPI001C34CDDE|nr:hypothetical protein BBOV_III002302 [Babesia bovis T2Bo]KAG6440045.1 hypothetical protein BBOV_III002302 [Babesia bovis T2Bo]